MDSRNDPSQNCDVVHEICTTHVWLAPKPIKRNTFHSVLFFFWIQGFSDTFFIVKKIFKLQSFVRHMKMLPHTIQKIGIIFRIDAYLSFSDLLDGNLSIL